MAFPYQLNDTGFGVSGIQHDLVYNGFTIPVDEVFGEQTVSAVKDFQIDHKLAVDGVAGPKTCRALMRKRMVDLTNDTPLPARWLIWGIEGQESSYDPGAVGYSHPADKGPVQINLDAPPDGPVTEDQAFNPDFAIPYLAHYLRRKIDEYRAEGRTVAEARKAAVCAWHAPAWGNEWGSTGNPPNDDAASYVAKVHALGIKWP